MYKSKLLELMQVFEEVEIERLKQFLSASYFTKAKPPKEVFLLMEHIAECFSDFSDSKLSKAYTYSVLYPTEDFIPGKVDRVMSNLLKIVKEFVIYEFSDLKDNEVERLLILAKFYRQRRMEKPFRHTIAAIEKAQSVELKKKDFYLKQFLVEQEIFSFENFYNSRKKDYNILATLRSLDVFYLVNKLEYISWLLAQNKYNIPLDVKDSMRVYNQIMSSIKDEISLDKIPLLRVYDHAIRLMQNEGGDEAAFRELKQLLEEYVLEIPLIQLKQFQALCRNYCMLEYNKGKTHFLEEVFALYQAHLEQGYLFHEGGLLPSTMRNIVVSGLRSKKYEWVYQFLEDYKDRIVATNQAKEIYLFNLATYFFALKEYSKALDCLADRYEDSYYIIAAKRLELKIYFELDFDLLESKIDAFKIYIYRVSQKILPDTPREGNNSFIDILKQIRNPKTLKNLPRIEKLIRKVEAKQSIAEKEWLLEKLAACLADAKM